MFSENFTLAGNGSVPLRSVGLQNQRTECTVYRGPLHCISNILQTEGIQGLYRGAGAMILRDVPGYALYFIPYTLLCGWMNPNSSGSPHPCSIWLAGGLAGKKHHGWTCRHTDILWKRHDLTSCVSILLTWRNNFITQCCRVCSLFVPIIKKIYSVNSPDIIPYKHPMVWIWSCGKSWVNQQN